MSGWLRDDYELGEVEGLQRLNEYVIDAGTGNVGGKMMDEKAGGSVGSSVGANVTENKYNISWHNIKT